MTKVSIDSAKCQGHGRCELIAPEHFEVGDDGYAHVLREDVAEDDLVDVREAVQSCPESAIVLTD
ncbi:MULTISPECIES: ferredoxin [Mycobacterium]|uniref:Ferredoxin n=1 Tax=Mycobacterium talmoniae TaxID=1858794 RepID=A0A2S8BN04_9MYCO|nr:ferredoxin [Mycobacterium talmoniae]PQM48018.1 Ferredoxin [Mycobacterium talmoniae]